MTTQDKINKAKQERAELEKTISNFYNRHKDIIDPTEGIKYNSVMTIDGLIMTLKIYLNEDSAMINSGVKYVII